MPIKSYTACSNILLWSVLCLNYSNIYMLITSYSWSAVIKGTATYKGHRCLTCLTNLLNIICTTTSWKTASKFIDELDSLEINLRDMIWQSETETRLTIFILVYRTRAIIYCHWFTTLHLCYIETAGSALALMMVAELWSFQRNFNQNCGGYAVVTWTTMNCSCYSSVGNCHPLATALKNKVHRANMEVGPRWAPCWPHETCYLGVPG